MATRRPKLHPGDREKVQMSHMRQLLNVLLILIALGVVMYLIGVI
jgi:hypothetical protein